MIMTPSSSLVQLRLPLKIYIFSSNVSLKIDLLLTLDELFRIL